MPSPYYPEDFRNEKFLRMMPDPDSRDGKIFLMFVKGYRRYEIAEKFPPLSISSVNSIIQDKCRTYNLFVRLSHGILEEVDHGEE